MDPTHPAAPAWTFHPATEDRWPDLERLFGPRGACAGCWCMWWRISRKEYEAGRGQGNRLALQALVREGREPGLIAYQGAEPAGWCSVAPRPEYAALERSRVCRRLDAEPVWSLPCFFVARAFRGQGLMTALARAACAHAAARGARIVEAYPTVPEGRQLQDVSSFLGVPSALAAAGFRECARPSRARAIYRWEAPQTERT